MERVGRGSKKVSDWRIRIEYAAPILGDRGVHGRSGRQILISGGSRQNGLKPHNSPKNRMLKTWKCRMFHRDFRWSMVPSFGSWGVYYNAQCVICDRRFVVRRPINNWWNINKSKEPVEHIK